MKSIKISNDLYKMIARAAETKKSSVEDQSDYWLRLGQKAELFLDAEQINKLNEFDIASDVQSISKLNNERLEQAVKEGKASPESVNWFSDETVKNAKVSFKKSTKSL